MLVSIAINPVTLGAMGVVDAHSRFGARRLLDAALRNAVFVAYSEEGLAPGIAAAVTGLGSQNGQQLAILAEEILKNHQECVVQPIRGVGNLDGPERLIALAQDYDVDLVVCANEEERRSVEQDLHDCECCLLAEYEDTNTEQCRRSWEQAVELTSMPTDKCLDTVGRAIKYSRRVILADKMIGRAASKNDTKGVKRFVKGVSFVAKAWAQTSPLAFDSGLSLEILTDSHHYHDLAGMRALIERSVDATDKGRFVSAVEIKLKLDSYPSVFSDRFLGVGRRAWCIQHGVDDLGQLFSSNIARRRPIILGADCLAYRRTLSKIKKLTDAS